MKSLMILGCLFFAAVLVVALAASNQVKLPSLRALKRAIGYPAGQLALNALGDGTRTIMSFKTDAAVTVKHLLMKRGSDANHVVVCTAAAVPLGVSSDEAEAAELPVDVQPLSTATGTVLMVASEAMATTDVPIYAAADGKIALQGVVKVGILRSTASADLDECEVEPCAPVVEPNGKTTKAGGVLAVPITHRSVVMTTGGAEALTLADGLPGQRLHLVLGTDGGDGTLTPTTKTGFATIVFADAKDNVELLFLNATDGWVITGAAGVAAPPVIS